MKFLSEGSQGGEERRPSGRLYGALVIIAMLLLSGCARSAEAPPPSNALNNTAGENVAPIVTPIITAAAATTAPPVEATAIPTAEPLVAVTVVPTRDAASVIYSDFSDALLGVTFQMPSDWTRNAPGEPFVHSYPSRAALSAEPDVYPNWGDFSYFPIQRVSPEGNDDPVAILLAQLENELPTNETISADKIAAITVDGRPAAMYTRELIFSGGADQTIIYQVVVADTLIFLLRAVAVESHQSPFYTTEINTILNTIAFEPPSLLRGMLQIGRWEPYLVNFEHYVSPENGVALRHPTGYTIYDEPGSLVVVSDESLRDGFQADEHGHAFVLVDNVVIPDRPSVEFLATILPIPDVDAPLVDMREVLIDGYTAEGLLFRNSTEPDASFEALVLTLERNGQNIMLVGIEYADDAGITMTTTGIIGNLQFGP